MIKGVGLPVSCMDGALDDRFAENLASQVAQSSLDAVVVLAQDEPYDSKGQVMGDEAQFYVPNAYVASLAQKYKEFIPACSIHPGRADAMEELERCIDAGMPVLKLLPNCLNVDYRERRYEPFWQRMAEVGMVLLSHTGGELTVKVYDPSFADPKRLQIPLECGVRTIAAHAAGRSGLFDPDWTDDLVGMFERYPHLYADNSALSSVNRARTLKKILEPHVQQRIIHGSDYPVPISALGPWIQRRLSWGECREIGRVENVIERDYLLKRAVGFEPSTFTRMDSLLSGFQQ